MLPDWMKEMDSYDPSEDKSKFILASIKTIGIAMSQIKVQKGHEKGRPLPALVKLFLMLGLILLLSLSQSKLILMVIAAALLLYLCSWPAIDIFNIFQAGLGASALAFLILLPAMILHPAGMGNQLRLLVKVFFSIVIVSIFNHTTQWNHITGALRKLHVPGIFIFTLDISLKYIVLLGNLINDLLTSVQLRSIGKNNKKYQSVGGVMGVTFIRGTEMNRQMYEAMLCRGFTDDYKGL